MVMTIKSKLYMGLCIVGCAGLVANLHAQSIIKTCAQDPNCVGILYGKPSGSPIIFDKLTLQGNFTNSTDLLNKNLYIQTCRAIVTVKSIEPKSCKFLTKEGKLIILQVTLPANKCQLNNSQTGILLSVTIPLTKIIVNNQPVTQKFCPQKN